MPIKATVRWTKGDDLPAAEICRCEGESACGECDGHDLPTFGIDRVYSLTYPSGAVENETHFNAIEVYTSAVDRDAILEFLNGRITRV